MTLSEMRRALSDGHLQLTKSLGQNFLHDANQIQRIVEAAELGPTDRVLEIGPGLGPLTKQLLEHSSEVFAIEKDGRLVEFLKTRFAVRLVVTPAGDLTPVRGIGGLSALRLVHADALDWLRDYPQDWSEWKLVSNLPYSVASPILVDLALSHRPPERLVATLQLEVVKRILAKPDTEDYGLLTLLLQLRYEPRGWFKIPPACFYPAPDVDSACVTLIRRKKALLSAEQVPTFVKLVKLAFSQRRKMMLKLLKSQWPEDRLTTALDQLGISRQERAEKVSLENFVALAQILHV